MLPVTDSIDNLTPADISAAAVRLTEMSAGFMQSQALYVVAKLGIADRLQQGPQTVAALADLHCEHGRMPRPSPCSAIEINGSILLTTAAFDRSIFSVSPLRSSGQGRSLPVDGKRCCKQAWLTRSSGVAGMPRSAR